MNSLTTRTARILSNLLQCEPGQISRSAVSQFKWTELRRVPEIGQKSLQEIQDWMLDGGYVYTRSRGWVRVKEILDVQTLERRLNDLTDEKKRVEQELASVNEQIQYVQRQIVEQRAADAADLQSKEPGNAT